MMLRKLKNSQNAFMLPIVLTFLVVISALGLTLLQASLQAQNATVRYSYTQMAHIASKAAIDYAEERYELNSSYSGTAEQDLVVTTKYRLTIEVVILYNEGSNAKRIQAFGRVYIPETAGNAAFVRDIQASIIRNGEVIVCATCGGSGVIDPATYEPLAWFDAGEPNSLVQPSSLVENQYITSLYGGAYDDVVEQRGSDAGSSPGRLSFGGDDLEFSYDGSTRGHQSNGVRFRGVNTPQGASVNQAYIQFTADQTKSSGDVDIIVEGVASDDAPTWSGSYAVDNATKTTTQITWSPPDWNSVGASGANERVDITAIVQELVNRSGWNPGNDMAFTFTYSQGPGVRTAEKGRNGDHPVLYIEWGGSGGGGLATSNGDQVGAWLDRSINNNDASLVFGSAPLLSTNAINGRNAVTFSSGALESNLSALASNNGITAFVVMRPRSSSDNSARFLTAMRSTESQDYNTYDGVVLLQRNGGANTVMSYYRNQIGESLTGVLDNNWAIYTSRISASWIERLLLNGAENYSSSISNINYDIDQLYLGGRRSNSSGTEYADADIAEIIVYDKAIECNQLNEIEAYLADKYGIAVTTKSC